MKKIINFIKCRVYCYKLEKIFGFKFQKWQKDYLLGKPFGVEIINARICGKTFNARRNGKIFIYILRLLLFESISIKKKDIANYIDEYHGRQYYSWFIFECLNINDILVKNGFKTNIID